MKNNLFIKFSIIFFLNFCVLSFANSEEFNFNVGEIEILDNGNLFKGLNRGIIETNDGLKINANTFVFNKLTNILEAKGKVKIQDEENNYIIFSDKAIYEKNEETVFTVGNSRAIDGENREITAEKITYKKIPNTIEAEGKVKIQDEENNYIIFSDKAIYEKNEETVFTVGNSRAIDGENREITAEKITYKKIPNTIEAEGKVKINDDIEDYELFSEKVTFFKNDEIIETKGLTEANIGTDYYVKSENVNFNLNLNELSSMSKSTIKDNNNQIFYLDEFKYYINNELLNGRGILNITNYNLPNSDKFYFSDGIFNLKTKKFAAKDPKINIHKKIFGENRNDPRIYGASAKGEQNKISVSKAIFTSCGKREGCPPWSIKSEEIVHDKEKRQINYKNAYLNVFDLPVFYFPKFFHPDPSVNKQSGLLKPEINKSNVLGSSITIPYFNVISKNKDYTFKPTWFDNDFFTIQNEYRQANKNSNLLADFGFVKGYKSPISKSKNNLSHLFLKYNLDLNLIDYNSSKLELYTEQVSNDTYLKVFDAHITKSMARPNDLNLLNSQAKLFLNHDNYNFETGFLSYENLSEPNESDRYQYILPYYSFDTVLEKNYFNGSISIDSSGSNNLSNTNNLKSNIINNVQYTMNNFITNLGFENDLNIAFKNLNSIGKNNSDYKSSPQVELISLFEANTSLPLIKKNENFNHYLTPKMSFRFNPSDMKNYSTSVKKIDVGNIFSLNRLGVNDTFESGRSLTLGLDFKREKNKLNDINKYFEIKLATVIRDKEEEFIPKSSTINRKNSNVFGSVKNNFNENISLNYNFSLDNDFNSFEYNEFNTTISYKNFETNFNFIEENGEIGDSNVFENSIAYNINENNFIKFKTRRNRKINLTEYYDLVYEYKNDCLTAGIKYKKSYYDDRDLKPNEDLFFTITLFPLTTYEYDANDLISN
ncbi:LPS assembly protein LptD [Candidatus Pelagibacter sp. HIMB1593]|uniref:LPS assembly protein LptD n=1 Tax=Candidatus Pelagibacter sp. HIMB1593 TaxID=3413355 RepID=UPI003F85B134